MVGDWETSSLDEYIGAAQSTFFSFPVNKNIPNIPGFVIRTAAQQLGVDYVFIDSNPNMGLLNAYLWWHADFYDVPCVPDAFNVSSLAFVSKKLERWQAMIEALLPELQTASCMPMLKTKPAQCLGLVLNDLATHERKQKRRRELLDAASTLLTIADPQEFLYEFPNSQEPLDASALFQKMIHLATATEEQQEERATKRPRKE